MSSDFIKCIRSFVAVVEQRSFVAAARSLFLSPPVLTKQIKWLESQLDKSLLIRTTRRFELTQAGVLYYDHAKIIIKQIDDAEAALHELDKELQGKLIISHSGFLNKPCLVESLQRFLNQHPKVTLEIITSASAEMLLSGEVDVCVSNQKWQNIGLIQDLLYSSHRRLYAAPSYLTQYGAPKSIEDLSKHKCLFFKHGNDQDFEWRPSRNINVPYTGPYITDSEGHFKAMLFSGFGLGWCIDCLVKNEVDKGRLIEITLPEMVREEDVFVYTRATFKNVIFTKLFNTMNVFLGND
ncbi:LysR family transcriptional regulator [Francisellaceae bacterium]|nr:LysR family transcriptional regulator [Francisellaceae bacterium]